MPSEETQSFFERAKHGSLIDQCARIVVYILGWIVAVISVLPIQLGFFPREDFWFAALGIPIGLLLLMFVIIGLLRWRLL